MKLLQINASYKPAYIYGGPTMSVAKLSEEMTKSGWITEVFTTTANGSRELEVQPGKAALIDGVKVTYFKRLTKDHTHFSPALIRSLFQNANNYDVIHIHAWWNLVSVLSCWAAQRKAVPVVISPRGTLSAYSFSNKSGFSKGLLHKWLGKRLLGNCFFHVTSEREMAAIAKLTKSKGIFTIPNFVALPEVAQVRVPGKSDILKLIFFSRIEEKKGLGILLDALVSIKVPFSLTIAGDGDPAYIDRLKRIARRNMIAGNIEWIGFQESGKFEMLAQHDLLVLPSYDENFGNVVIESLSEGTAVLISNNVGLSDYVLNNRLGWVCENNSLSFNQMLNEIGRVRSELIRIRQEAPLKIRTDFSSEKLRERYIKMYNQIIDND